MREPLVYTLRIAHYVLYTKTEPALANRSRHKKQPVRGSWTGCFFMICQGNGAANEDHDEQESD